MEKLKTDAFGRTEEQQQDSKKRTETIINNLKGIPMVEVRRILNSVDYFLEEKAIIN